MKRVVSPGPGAVTRGGRDSPGERDMSGKEGRAKVWLGRSQRSGPQGPGEACESCGHYKRALALICSVLLFQGLQGIQGPKVSLGA